MSRIHAKRLHANDRYVPIDHLLDLPRVRVLRQLRWFDWASTEDLMIALGEDNNPARQALTRALERGITEGHVERDAANRPYLYRVTAAGREFLRLVMAKGNVSAA